jgi:ribosomal protein S18 acetylase RimI-like enzyme
MKSRVAVESDVTEIVRVINAAYRVEDFFVNGNRTSDADVRRRMSEGVVFLVIDGNPGTLSAAVAVDVHEGRGHFAMLSVDPSLQGSGLGRVLIDDIEEFCRDAGCTDLDIEVVNLREELPAFYRRFGFTEAGTFPFTPAEKLKREAHLVKMSKSLA